MRIAAAILALAAPMLAVGSVAQDSGPVDTTAFRTTYIRLQSHEFEGLLYTPTGARSRIALIYSHPNANNFDEGIAGQMARRGYPILMVNAHGGDERDDAYLPGISQGIAYLRTLPGVEKVVIIGHSGGGHLTALYQNVAEHGAGACNGSDVIYPCRTELATGLAKADGVVLLDPTLGAFHQMSSIDPAAGGRDRDAALDMFASANGYDAEGKRTNYPAAFRERFFAGQAARSERLTEKALARVAAIDAGESPFSDDEPFVVQGMGVRASGARLYQPDLGMLAHTRGSYPLLRADGTETVGVVHTVRPPSGQQAAGQLRSLENMTGNTTVRKYLALTAFRTLPGYAITADNIVGADWGSAYTSTPRNAAGITVPTLMLTMGCHYLVVPGEIIFEHVAARDKSLMTVEGGTHVFAPCKPEYGDTAKRTFDALAAWLAKPGRF